MILAPKKYLLFKLCQDKSKNWHWVVAGDADNKADCATLAYDLENVYIWRKFREEDAQEFLRLLQECNEVTYKIEPTNELLLK